MSDNKIQFTHLHVHTRYSKADGQIDIEQLAKKLLHNGMTSCAITDHGCMHGVIPFYDTLTKYGIKPILGYESYTNDDNAHLILLAKTNEGFKNLLKVCSLENVDGFKKAGKFAKGNLDLEEVRKQGLGKGIIALTACLGGSVSRLLLEGNSLKAAEYVAYLEGIFDDVYLELQDNSTKEQAIVNMQMQELAIATGKPMVITKDAHYLNQEDWEAHDALLAKQINKPINDPTRWRFPGGHDYYVCTPEEMEAYCRANSLPMSVMENTNKIADECNVTLFGKNGVYNENLFPDYDDIPKGYTQTTYLRKLAMDGLIEFIRTRSAKYKMDVKKYIDRLNYELDVIEKTGFEGYFLIIWDFMKYCKEYRDPTHPTGIGTGAGRGSGVGSLVCRALNITKVDPVKYNLLFERFLNPERKSAPDVDLDVSDLDRPLVIEYMLSKYGQDRVGQIVTFTQLKVAGGTRDLMRLCGKNKAEQDLVCNLIEASFPEGSATSAKVLQDLYANPDDYREKFGNKFDGAYEIAKKYQEVAKAEPWIAKTVEKLEGSITATGVHAGGVLVFPGPSSDYAPMTSVLSSKAAVLDVCQYDMSIIDKLGILKLDILGLTTSRIISKTAVDVGIDIDNIDLEDEKIYQMLKDGHTVEVFQFEGGGMTKALIDSKVSSLEDLIALVSLYRPGPLDAVDPDTGKTIYDTYIECCKNGQPKTVHPRLEPILGPSKGNMIYQEQIMQTVMEMGNCSLGYADIVRRAMGKKKKELMAKMKLEFMYGLRVYDKDAEMNETYNVNNPLVLKDDGNPVIVGACNNGFTEKEASDMWSVIEIFARYAFNKSHAAAYALNAYQTAYLKYYYPAEFMANALTACGGEQKDIIKDIAECKRLGVMILPPCVNKSEAGFTVETTPDGRKAIRFGLGAIKNISSVDAIREEREINGEFTSMREFFTRVKGRTINKTKAGCLILAGAFDWFNTNRHELYNDYFANVRGDKVMPAREYEAKKEAGDKNISSFFVKKDEINYSGEDALIYEKDLIGMYVSGHPLDKYVYVPWDNEYLGSQCEAYAIVKDIKVMQDKKKRAYAFFKAETLGDIRDCVMWANDYAKYGDKLIENKVVCLRGVKDTNQRGDYQFKVMQILVRLNKVTSVTANKTAMPQLQPPPSISATFDPTAELFAYA